MEHKSLVTNLCGRFSLKQFTNVYYMMVNTSFHVSVNPKYSIALQVANVK